MLLSANTLKWVMRFYPPLLSQRIWVQRFEEDMTGVRVKISKSWLNRNYNGSIFGGTIFSAADPFLPVLFHQLLTRNGKKDLRIWSKSARIDFVKPAFTDLYFNISVAVEDLTEVDFALRSTGKFEKVFPIDIYDKNEIVCATVNVEVYIRDLSIPRS